MENDGSPFAQVPEPGVGPIPSPVTYEQQIASAGSVARGLRYKARWVRVTVQVLVVLMVVSIALALLIPLAKALVT